MILITFAQTFGRMKIAIIGTGYVGLVSGTCFADMGIDVTCIDIDSNKIAALREGIVPIYEPGLDEMVKRNHQSGRLKFTTDLAEVIDDVEVIFTAVGTPPDEDGSADLHYVLDVARNIGRLMNRYVLIVTKSTVPVGTAKLIRSAVSEELDKRGLDIDFDIASNPEFLKEGAAIKDFMSPDRVVVGTDSERAAKLMKKLYRPFLVSSDRMLFTDIPSAEMIKYAANAMLATRISFMNDIANLCDLVGANVNMVRKGIGADHRIGTKFLYPGCGYGGSCFPKDVKAIIRTAQQHGYDMKVLSAVEEVNEQQKSLLFKKLDRHYKSELKGKTVAVWGLAFKPETDDMREAPALTIIDLLSRAGAVVKAYDPIAMDECRRRIGDKVTYCKNMYDAVIDADALMLLTEWKEFRMPSWQTIAKTMHSPVVLDGRNIYDRAELESEGFTYYALGK